MTQRICDGIVQNKYMLIFSDYILEPVVHQFDHNTE